MLDIAADVIPALPNVRAILFEAVAESVRELGANGLAAILDRLPVLTGLPVSTSDTSPIPAARAAAPGSGTAAREAELLTYTTRASDTAAPDPGAGILRYLTDQARLSLLVADHAPTLLRLLTEYGRAETDRLLTEFLAATPASAWRHEQSAAFARWCQCELGGAER